MVDSWNNNQPLEMIVYHWGSLSTTGDDNQLLGMVIGRNIRYIVCFRWIHRNFFLGETCSKWVRPQKFRANFSQFGRISSIAQPKNLLNWGNFAQIERHSPEIFEAKLNCAGSPISGEKNNYCVYMPKMNLSKNSSRSQFSAKEDIKHPFLR
jgi:hypothetical protein